MHDHQWITIKQAAALVGTTPQTLYMWSWRGKLQVQKVGKLLMTTPVEVRRAADVMARNPGGRKRLSERQEVVV